MDFVRFNCEKMVEALICVKDWLRPSSKCNTPSPWGRKRYVFLTSYLNFGTKRTELPLKTERSQAKRLTISPCKSTEA